MEEPLLILLGLAVLGLPVLFVVGCLVALARLFRRVGDLEVECRVLRSELRAAAGARPPLVPSSPPPVPVAPAAAPPPAPASPPPMPVPARAVVERAGSPPLPEPQPPPSPASAPPAPLPSLAWEQFLGARLFAWLGGLALFIGIAFFIKYSFEQNLIPPGLRIAIGVAAGITLASAGIWIRGRRHAALAQSLAGTGVVVLYASLYGAHGLYGLLSLAPTFLLMALVTAGAFGLALFLNAAPVAAIGLLGGFLTPFLLRADAPQTLPLFGYIGLLDIGLLAVSSRREWPALRFFAAAGTLMIQTAWLLALEPRPAWTITGNFLAFCLLLGGALWRSPGRPATDPWSLAAAALPAVSAVFVFTWFLHVRADSGTPWLAGYGAATLMLLGAAVLRPALSAVFAGVTTFTGISLVFWAGAEPEAASRPSPLLLFLAIGLIQALGPWWLLRRHGPHRVSAWALHAAPLLLLSTFVVFAIEGHGLSPAWWPAIFLLDLALAAAAVLVLAWWALLGIAVLNAVLLLVCAARAPVMGTSPGLDLAAFALFGAALAAGLIWAARTLAARAKPPGAFAGEPFLTAAAGLFPFLLLSVTIASSARPEFPAGPLAIGLAFVVGLLGADRLFNLPLLPLTVLAGGFGLIVACGGPSPAGESWPLLAIWQLAFVAPLLIQPLGQTGPGMSSRWAAASLSLPLHFFVLYPLWRPHVPAALPGLVPAACALPYLALFGHQCRRLPASSAERPAILAWIGGAALYFITLVIPIQFDRQWLTLGWALEGAALLWLCRHVPHWGLRAAGVALLAVTFLRLGANPAVLEYHPRSGTPVFNWYLYTYGLGAASLYLGAWLLPPTGPAISRTRGLLVAGGTWLLFVLLNLEIADAFSTGAFTMLEFSGNFARDMTYSIAWAVFALLLLAAGIHARLVLARRAGMALFFITLAKLFFHDMAQLEALFRIASFMAVAVLLLAASFLYQRFAGDQPEPPN